MFIAYRFAEQRDILNAPENLLLRLRCALSVEPCGVFRFGYFLCHYRKLEIVSVRNKFVEPDQKGTWLTHFHMCLQIARAVRRLHAAGLAHSDLSYKNVLVDP